MFDHAQFDKTAFDKQTLSDSSNYIFTSYSNFRINLILPLYLSLIFDGEGGISSYDQETLNVLSLNFSGDSDFVISQIGNISVSFISLEDIMLNEGDRITIDTEAMTILVGRVNPYHDVRSVTADSTFFKLGPGLNELKFEAIQDRGIQKNINEELDVKIIWQNRWL